MRPLIFSLTLALLVGNAYSGETASTSSGAPLVVVAKVGEAEDVEVRRYTGHVASVAEVQLVTRISGELLKVNFNEGDIVEEGQVLYELDPVRYKAAVTSAEAAIEEADARLGYAEISFKRFDELHVNKATTKDSRDSAESEYHACQAALLNAEARLVTADDDLKNTRVLAPISGKIGATKYTRGNYLTPSSGTIATIVQVDPIRVTFTMSTRDFLSMFNSERELKDTATIRLKLANGAVYSSDGVVEFIDNHANSRTDTLKIFVKFANPNGVLVPGNSLQVMLSRSEGGKLPAILPSAVMHDSKTAYVYVMDDENRIARRDVELGPSTSTLQLIRTGLEKGESIVVDGSHKARPGMTVRYVTSE